MSRYLVTINSTADRNRAVRIVAAAPFGSRIEVKAQKRSLDQNSKMWVMLTDIAQQIPWHGQTLRPDDWKLLFLDALRRESQIIPNLNGDGFVNLGWSSSDLSKTEMSDLIEIIHEFGARHGVEFQDDKEGAAT